MNPATAATNGQEKESDSLVLPQRLPSGLILHRTGLEIQPDISEATLREAVGRIKAIAGLTTWAYADIARAADKQDYGGTKVELANAIGCSINRVLALARTAQAFDIVDRHPRLTFEHHAVVLECEPTALDQPELWRRKAKDWLDRAEREGWSARELRHVISGPAKEKRLARIIGFTPCTKIGSAVANQMATWFAKSTLTSADQDYGRRVLRDLERLACLTRRRIDTASSNEEGMAHGSAAHEEALRLALQELVAGENVTTVAHTYSLTTHELGHHRLVEAAKLLGGEESCAEIARRFHLNPDKLRTFARKAAAEKAARIESDALPGVIEGQATQQSDASPSDRYEAALTEIQQGMPLNKAARQFNVDRKELIRLRYDRAAQFYRTMGKRTVRGAALKFGLDPKNFRKHMAQCGLPPTTTKEK